MPDKKIADRMADGQKGKPWPTLGDLNKDTNNNLSLLRIAAATSVALSHSYLTVTGDPDSRPLISLTGFSVGFHAVNIFFFISGLLVTQSWIRRSSLISFSIARSLRIFPALILCVFLITFVLGLGMTSLPRADYLSSLDTFKYFVMTASLFEPSGILPGVFVQNPDPFTINGSLWTLRYELICYAALAIMGISGIFRHQKLFLYMSIVAGLVLTISSTLPIAHDYTFAFAHFVRFGICFGLGVVALQYQKFLPVHWSGVVALIALTALTRDTPIYQVFLYLATAYTTLWLAYVPNGRIRLFNNVGDYSYGIYIYAYPVQQTLIGLWPDIQPAQMFILTMLTILPLAMASWHAIEKPALQLKSKIVSLMQN